MLKALYLLEKLDIIINWISCNNYILMVNAIKKRNIFTIYEHNMINSNWLIEVSRSGLHIYKLLVASLVLGHKLMLAMKTLFAI